jgi:DNA methylase
MAPLRHPLHSLCPYFAMFPEDFVERHVIAHTKPGDIVFDPFCGRGTTVFQSLLMNRPSSGVDINPVAACVAGAKSNPPSLVLVLQRIDELERLFVRRKRSIPSPSPFFERCFHQSTLQQILFLRQTLTWRKRKEDRFIAAMMLGALHGESHRSQRYLSNRMPRTISTKPDYSIRWWNERGLVPPERDAFLVMRDLARFRFRLDPAMLVGTVRLGDARKSARLFPKLANKVRLVITSPPYLDVTDYAEDQWLRLWFLGGEPFPTTQTYADDRLTNDRLYWKFLQQAWSGLSPLLTTQSRIVVRIGGRQPQKDLAHGLMATLREGLVNRRVRRIAEPLTTEVRGRQTNIFRPGARPSVEHDFVFSIS